MILLFPFELPTLIAIADFLLVHVTSTVRSTLYHLKTTFSAKKQRLQRLRIKIQGQQG